MGILTVIPLQLLSFHIAVLRGYDVSTQLLCSLGLKLVLLKIVMQKPTKEVHIFESVVKEPVTN